MTKAYFVRHAQPNINNHDDMTRELTEKGLADTALVTRFLSDKDISAVLSSPYKRAVDTVKPFAESAGLKMEIVPDFRERGIDIVWIEDFNSFAQWQWSDFDYKLSGGESLREVQHRNISALEAALKRLENRNFVVGSHGTALSTIINYYDPKFGYENFEEIKPLMPFVVCFEFNNNKFVTYTKHDFSIERRIKS